MDFSKNGSFFKETTSDDPTIDRDAYKKELPIPENKLKEMGKPDGHVRFVLFKHKKGAAVVCDAQIGPSMGEYIAETLAENDQMLDVFEKAVSLARLLKSPAGDAVRQILKMKHSMEEDLHEEKEGILGRLLNMRKKFLAGNKEKPTNEKGECMCPACQLKRAFFNSDTDDPSAN